MQASDSPRTRYQVHIRSTRTLVECKGLAQVLAFLARQVGSVRVLDRLEGNRVFEGTIDEFCESLWAHGQWAEEGHDAAG